MAMVNGSIIHLRRHIMPISNERLQERAESRCGRTHYEGFRCLICDATEMARELLERREADRWIPVSERLPEDRKPVLVFTVGLSKPDGIRMASFNKDQPLSMFWHGQIAGYGKGVTHWRPLPAPPDAKRIKEGQQ